MPRSLGPACLCRAELRPASPLLRLSPCLFLLTTFLHMRRIDLSLYGPPKVRFGPRREGVSNFLQRDNQSGLWRV